MLRTLGARSRTLAVGLIVEYAVLGLLAGTVASAAAQGTAWVLAWKVFDMHYAFSPLIWLVGAGTGTALVTLLGYSTMRGVLKQSPRAVLG